jgi:hypothetical protein
MDALPTRCPKCEGEMVRGFVPVFMQDRSLVSRWAMGVPRRSFWMGLKVVAEKDTVPIGAFRCASCGFLEFYARSEFAAQ